MAVPVIDIGVPASNASPKPEHALRRRESASVGGPQPHGAGSDPPLGAGTASGNERNGTATLNGRLSITGVDFRALLLCRNPLPHDGGTSRSPFVIDLLRLPCLLSGSPVCSGVAP